MVKLEDFVLFEKNIPKGSKEQPEEERSLKKGLRKIVTRSTMYSHFVMIKTHSLKDFLNGEMDGASNDVLSKKYATLQAGVESIMNNNPLSAYSPKCLDLLKYSKFPGKWQRIEMCDPVRCVCRESNFKQFEEYIFGELQSIEHAVTFKNLNVKITSNVVQYISPTYALSIYQVFCFIFLLGHCVEDNGL